MGKGKRYSRREDYIMLRLGLKPQPGSGSQWTQPEDGEDDNFLAQLKSTDGKSIAVKRQDVKDLIYHAIVAHKTPIFVLDFIGDYQLICIRPDDLEKVSALLNVTTKDGVS